MHRSQGAQAASLSRTENSANLSGKQNRVDPVAAELDHPPPAGMCGLGSCGIGLESTINNREKQAHFHFDMQLESTINNREKQAHFHFGMQLS